MTFIASLTKLPQTFKAVAKALFKASTTAPLRVHFKEDPCSYTLIAINTAMGDNLDNVTITLKLTYAHAFRQSIPT